MWLQDICNMWTQVQYSREIEIRRSHPHSPHGLTGRSTPLVTSHKDIGSCSSSQLNRVVSWFDAVYRICRIGGMHPHCVTCQDTRLASSLHSTSWRQRLPAIKPWHAAFFGASCSAVHEFTAEPARVSGMEVSNSRGASSRSGLYTVSGPNRRPDRR